MSKIEKIKVFGHRNPDSDSICAAIAYAHLKNTLEGDHYEACRLGPINRETNYVLNYFNMTPPRLLEDVKPTISDLNLKALPILKEDHTILDAMKYIAANPGRSLTVTDDAGKLLGVVSLSDIFSSYNDIFKPDTLKNHRTSFEKIITMIEGRLAGNLKDPFVKGNVYLYFDLGSDIDVHEEDIIILTNEEAAYLQTFSTKAFNMIVCNVPIGTKLPIPEDYPGMVCVTAMKILDLIRLLPQLVPVRQYIQRKDIEYFVEYENLQDVKKNIMTSKRSRFPVVDKDGYVIGTIEKANLLDFNRKQVILVDHNERSQSIEGIEEASILEVIDHHRIAEIQTTYPAYLRIEPVGSTCTIVAKMYEETNTIMPRPIAGILLSAIVSDTLLFHSPTCTQTDKDTAEKLAQIAGLNLKNYGEKMLIEGSNLDALSSIDILTADQKVFSMGNYRVSISQINTSDFKNIFKKIVEIKETMAQLSIENHYDLMILAVTDFIVGGSEIIIHGEASKIARTAFGMKETDDTVYLPNVFSRKKQIVPPVMNIATMQ